METQEILVTLGVMLAGTVGGIALASIKRPGKVQDQLLLLALGGGAAYMMRQLEGRGAATDAQGHSLAALSERVKTLFTVTDTLSESHERHTAEMTNLRVEVQAVVASVANLVDRLDRHFNEEREAMVKQNRRRG